MVYGGFAFGLIVQAGAGNAEQLALPDNAERGMVMPNHASPAGDAHHFPQALAKKSRSTVSWPILAWSSCRSFSLLASSVLISPEKMPEAYSLSCLTHRWICVWWTPNSELNSVMVFSPEGLREPLWL
jgi:hypothetical protein